ncbi:MAG: endo-1,4-beta-xylanase, partial [Promicromonosporaceae bacterium]|nr:endo-1,4-beta-xylanase [Promicromonosporaceae bacterium]
APSRIHLWNNDYNTQHVGAKLDILADLSENHVRNGMPLDGKAHQFHMGSATSPHNIWRALEVTSEMNDRLVADGYWALRTAVTEWDVTNFGLATDPNNLEGRLDAQGWYHYEAFNYFRRWAQENPGLLEYVTIWGLQDQRSWVGPPPGAGLPTLFSGERECKPAFWGAAGNPGAWPENAGRGWHRLSRQDRVIDVFGGAPLAAAADFGTVDWGSVPSFGLGFAGDVVLRHSEDGYLVAFVSLTDDVASLEFDYQVLTGQIVVNRDGSVTGNATAQVREGEDGWYAIVHIPHVRPAITPELNIVARNAAGEPRGELGAVNRMLLRFQVGFQTGYIVEAAAAPVLGDEDERDAAWDDAVWESTAVNQQGSADGATADFALLWGAGTGAAIDGAGEQVVDTLFFRAEVTDSDIHTGHVDAHQRDSVELLLDLGNAKAGPYRDMQDAQFRFEALATSWVRSEIASSDFSLNEALPAAFSHGNGDTNRQQARLHQLHIWFTDTGYVVEAEIGLWFFNEHPTVDSSVSFDGAFHGFDVQVNDATTDLGRRTSVQSWSNPNTTAWNTTLNWGVVQQVSICAVDGLGDLWSNDPLCVEPDVTFGADRLGVRRGNRFFKNLELVGGTAEITFTFGREADEVFIGDWNGDGIDTPAIRRGNRFYLTNHQQGGWADTIFTFGRVGDEVFVGDWNASGYDTLAIRRGNQIFVSNVFVSGPASEVFTFGRATDQLIPGNFDGEPGDTFAVRRGNEIFVSNTLRGGNADYSFTFGRAGDEVFAGDWNGSGYDTWSLRRGNEFFKSYSPTATTIDHRFTFGRLGDDVFVGHWGTN